MAKRGRVNVVQGQQSICKIRVVDCVQNRPAVFCFVLSLFLIGITLALLGLYITERDHMPDLDAMKVLPVTRPVKSPRIMREFAW